MSKNRRRIRPKSREEVRNDQNYRLQRLEVIRALGLRLLNVTLGVGFFYFGLYKSIEAAAGKTTTISYLVGLISGLKLDVAVSLGVNAALAGLIVWGRRQWLQERKEKDERIKTLETGYDPKRSTSAMTISGHKALPYPRDQEDD